MKKEICTIFSGGYTVYTQMYALQSTFTCQIVEYIGLASMKYSNEIEACTDFLWKPENLSSFASVLVI